MCKEAFPIQILMEAFVDIRLPIVCHIDNAQILTDVKKGYSKKLCQLYRTQRCALGVVHECVIDKVLKVSFQHCSTDLQKADLFTEALVSAKYAAACIAIGMRK